MVRFLFGRKLKAIGCRLLPLVLVLAFAVQARAQVASPAAAGPSVVESGKFRLHKFEQPIGEETYEVSRDGDSLVVKSHFKFTDRGSSVPLETTLRTKQNLTPVSFEIKGKTARGSTIDTSVEIRSGGAIIREGKEARQVSVSGRFF